MTQEQEYLSNLANKAWDAEMTEGQSTDGERVMFVQGFLAAASQFKGVYSREQVREAFWAAAYKMLNDQDADYVTDDALSRLASLPVAPQPSSLRWVKASDRLPEQAGDANKVLVRCKRGALPFVGEGFKNYSTEPALYIDLGYKSLLTVNGEGDPKYNTVSASDVEWLEETAAPQPEAEPVEQIGEARLSYLGVTGMWEIQRPSDEEPIAYFPYKEKARAIKYTNSINATPQQPNREVVEALTKWVEQQGKLFWNRHTSDALDSEYTRGAMDAYEDLRTMIPALSAPRPEANNNPENK